MRNAVNATFTVRNCVTATYTVRNSIDADTDLHYSLADAVAIRALAACTSVLRQPPDNCRLPCVVCRGYPEVISPIYVNVTTF